MQIKSFSARSGKEVLARIKEELGPDAVILDSREENGVITMTAATERDLVTRRASALPEEETEPLPDQASLPLPGFEPIGGRPMRYQPFTAELSSGPPRPLSAVAAKNLPLVPDDDGEEEAAGRNLRPMRAQDAAAEAFRAAQARTRAGQKALPIPTREELAAAEREAGYRTAIRTPGPLVAPGDILRASRSDLPPVAAPAATGAARRTSPQPPREITPPRRTPSADGGAARSAGDARAVSGQAQAPQGAYQAGAAVPPGWQQWHEEWSSLKNHIMALMKPALRLDELPPRQRLAIEFLQREGVEDEAVLRLYQRLQQDPTASILAPLARLVPVRTWSAEYWPQRIQVVTGPFGAGKTSVSIRMALSLRKSAPGCRICVVNADATRGNGRLLLRHYCDLSDMAYKEASTTLELVSALNAALREGFDRIIVDLPGLSRGRYLATLLADAGLDERTGETPDDLAVHLALPPHYGSQQLRGLLKRYSCAHASSIVWTKLDEAEQYGQLVNVAVESGLPVSALSFGPGLGNSLTPARENMLWRLLFKRELPMGN